MQVESEWTGNLLAHERANTATVDSPDDFTGDPPVGECVIRRRADLDERSLLGGVSRHEHRIDDLLERQLAFDPWNSCNVSEGIPDRDVALSARGEFWPQRIDACIQVDQPAFDAHQDGDRADALRPGGDDTHGVVHPLRAVLSESTPQINDLATVHRRGKRRPVLVARVILVEHLGHGFEAGCNDSFATHPIERAIDGVAVISLRV